MRSITENGSSYFALEYLKSLIDLRYSKLSQGLDVVNLVETWYLTVVLASWLAGRG